MRFHYHSYPVRGAGTTRYAMVHRPMIPLRVIGPTGEDDFLALADTGADDTLLPDFLIKSLGVIIAPGDQALIVGIDGGRSVVRYGTLDLELPGPGGGYRWSARAGFHANFNAILGHTGFFEHVTATFNGQRRHITLTPNGSASAPTIVTR
jgi:hypothetical protein